jgi:hypothetical protein
LPLKGSVESNRSPSLQQRRRPTCRLFGFYFKQSTSPIDPRVYYGRDDDQHAGYLDFILNRVPPSLHHAWVRRLTVIIFSFNIPQKLKTRVVKKSVNPEWDEELTLSIEDPAVPIRLVCVRFHPSFLSQISCLGSFAPTLSNVYKLFSAKSEKGKKILYC